MVVSLRINDYLGAAYLSVCVVLVLLSVSIARTVWVWYRLRHIPGPALASVSATWLIRKLSSGRFHAHMCEVSEKYGPLVRIGPNELLCTDPETLKRISAVRSPYVKGDFYETGRIIPGYDNVVSQRDEVEHKALRAKMAGGYSGRENGSTGFEAGIDRQLKQLIALIEAKYLSDRDALRPFELSSKAQFFALDVISDLSFGNAFGFLVEDRDLYQYIEINDSAVPVMNMLQAVPWMTNIIYRWPMRLALPSDGDKVGFGRLMGLARGFVEERLRAGANPGKDMLQGFINGGMTYDELIQHMFVQIVAGSITTAAAIRHTLLALVSTPAAYAALRREIDQGIATRSIGSTPFITDAEAQALPYLQAVIREGLRMWPPTTGLGCKQVPKGGDILCGFKVPAGTQIAQNFSGLMRVKSVWGEDADVFRPERWLEAAEEGEERVKYLNSVLDLDFGSGKYQCLGKRIALMELNKIFVELLRRYEFAAVNPQRPIESISGIFWVASDLWLRVTKRQ